MARRILLLTLFVSLASETLANFINSFETPTEGASLEISWEQVPEESLPMYISGRVFNNTGRGINSFEANISSSLSAPSFIWSNIPYPLPYIPTAHYELELRSLQPTDGSSSSTANSPLFSIAPSSRNVPPPDEKPPGPTSPGSYKVTEPGGPDIKPIIVAVCVSLGIPFLAATTVCIWWTRRHRRRAKYEESRRERYQTIID